MHAVIFIAKVAELDEEYSRTAERMRQLAIENYGCAGFDSVADGENEISISYWESLHQIRAWKHDAEHLAAQALGKSRWYRWYKVQVVEVLREYQENCQDAAAAGQQPLHSP